MPEAPEKQTAVVDRGLEDQVATEALLALRARKDASKRVFDPRLGATREEATARVEQIRNDLGAYGEFVHGHTPARHHTLWIDLIHGLTSGTLTETAIRLGLLPETERGTFRNKLLLLAPPASAKSSWCSIALPTWYLGKYPDRTVLFFTSSDPAAVGFGNTIKILLEQAKEHKEIWPDQAGRPDKRRGWSSDGLYLKATPMSGQSPAYRAVGWGASVMGQRANLLIIDDPMNQENAESGIEQAKAKRYYDMTLGPRLQPGSGAALAVMTRWAEGDLASHFIEKAEQGGDWLVVPLPMVAEAGDPLGRKPGELLWPEQYPRSFVEMQRKSMGSAAFACVTGGTRVELVSDPSVASSRPYQGDVVVLRTARGYDLTCTPNHPIVTRNGRVPAGSLRVGDDVFSRSLHLGAQGSRDHDDDIPPTIEQIWHLLAEGAQRAPENARTTTDDFHGDGIPDGEVRVIATNRALWDEAYAALREQRAKLAITRGLRPTRFFGADSSPFKHGGGLGLAAPGLPHPAPVLGALAQDAQALPLGHSSGLNAGLTEVVEHERAVAPVAPGDSPTRFPAKITPDRIVNINRVPFYGHVYNLQTDSNTYLSNGVLVGNCVYNCSTAQIAGDVFSDERWFKPLPANFADIRESLLVIQGVDVAFSEKDRACFTVVLTLGLNVATGDAYILNVLRDRMTVGQTEDALVSQILTFRPGVTGIEDTAFKHAVTAELVANVRRRVYANIVAVPPREMVKGRSDKVARARLPAQRAEAGLLYADKQAHWWPAFISEVLAFPRGRTNDQVDALSLAMYMPLRLRVQDHRPKPFTFNPH
jgi:predicted phage terminase large subunit-like protein